MREKRKVWSETIEPGEEAPTQEGHEDVKRRCCGIENLNWPFQHNMRNVSKETEKEKKGICKKVIKSVEERSVARLSETSRDRRSVEGRQLSEDVRRHLSGSPFRELREGKQPTLSCRWWEVLGLYFSFAKLNAVYGFLNYICLCLCWRTLSGNRWQENPGSQLKYTGIHDPGMFKNK